MSQKTDNMIKLALVFFVSLLSFSIGTYVGKKYSDNQHKLSLLEPKKEMPAPKTDEFASDTSEIDKTHGLAEDEIASDKKPAALTDSEVAKIAEEFATEDIAAEEKLVATLDPQEKELKTITDTSTAMPTTKPSAKTTSIPAAKDVQAILSNTSTNQAAVQKTQPMAARTEERTPASIAPKKEVAPLHFTVQIGSFPTQTEA